MYDQIIATRRAAQQISTRFLLPFSILRGHLKEGISILELMAREDDSHQSFPVWQPAVPHQLYEEEALEHVLGYFFEAERQECSYLKVPDATANSWFNSLRMELKIGDATQRWRVRLMSLAGIELFLSRHGVGVLSIALELEKRDLLTTDCLEFNYRLSQVRPQTAASLRVDHPSDNAVAWSRMSKSEQGRVAIPLATAPLKERLGRAGGSFTLYEVAEELVRPLEAVGLQVLQNEFSVYTAVRFGDDVVFDDRATSPLAAFLAGLAQIEEQGHPGSGLPTHAVLNQHHFVAVGLLGAAHLLSDQPGGHSYNSQRLPKVFIKYFFIHLVATMQRWVLRRVVVDSAAVLHLDDKDEMQVRLAEVRQGLMEFALEGYFSDISYREVLHRYYRVSQVGLDVPATLQGARRAITDLDAKFAADRQIEIAKDMAASAEAANRLQYQVAQNVSATRELQREMTGHLKVVARVQTILEWLEVFIISVYAAELWHMFAADYTCWFPDWATQIFGTRDAFVSWGVLVTAVLFAIGALIAIRPWHHEANSSVAPDNDPE
jgi:hypothetical protein